MQIENTNEDLLTFETEFIRAETGKRFLNYIIDIALFYILTFIVGVIFFIALPELRESVSKNGVGVSVRVILLVMYGLYMGVIEAAFSGKSLGKLITQTRAVNVDGTRISAKTAFLRGCSKAVPFCAFSALGSPCNPWQDKWTDTIVVDERKSIDANI